MDIIELIAIIILVAAIVFLIYYYIQTSNGNEVDLKEIFHIPPNREDENANVSVNGSNQKDNEAEVEFETDGGKVSMTDKIKVTFKDIDKTYINTDAFSKRLDAFLDEKSEELIENWSLVTTDNISTLEERTIGACESIDELEKRFSEYSNVTNEKIDDLDKRLKVLEKETEELEE